MDPGETFSLSSVSEDVLLNTTQGTTAHLTCKVGYRVAALAISNAPGSCVLRGPTLSAHSEQKRAVEAKRPTPAVQAWQIRRPGESERVGAEAEHRTGKVQQTCAHALPAASKVSGEQGQKCTMRARGCKLARERFSTQKTPPTRMKPALRTGAFRAPI